MTLRISNFRLNKMKKIYSLFLVFAFLFSCGVKQTQKLIGSGNYDEAITNAISNLRNNKDKKSNQDYVYLLEEAFAKAKNRDLNTINLLEKDKNPANYERIYNTYLQLNNRQERIKPILPLKLLTQNRNAIFPFENYNDKIVSSKNNLSVHLYSNAKLLLATTNKMNFRKSFDDLTYLNQINPNYKNCVGLIEEARFKGTDFVFVNTKNETNLVIPQRLQKDLLDFNANGINKNWTVFHNSKQSAINYDYYMTINFREINISPEQIKEREFIKEREITDGQKKLIDATGKEVKDENGNVVMVDNLRKVTIQIFESRQLKSCFIRAKIDFINNTTKQLMQSFPLESEYVFENSFAIFKGDKRACDDDYLSFFDRSQVSFPSTEQMIFDAGEDLKWKLKNIINQNNF